MQQAYERASSLYQLCNEKCVLNERPTVNFIKGTQDFWYAQDFWSDDGEAGVRYVRFDFAQGKTVPLFDHKALLAAIAPYCEEEAKLHKLPVENPVFEQPNKLYFNIKKAVGEFVFDTEANTLDVLRFPKHSLEEVTSPDGKHSLYIQNHNIFTRDNETGKERQLTKDGCENLDYGLRFLSVSEELLSATPAKRRPALVWSPNSKYFITYRADRRLLGNLHLMQSVPKDGSARPNGPAYPYALPGDEHILEGEVYIGDIEAGTVQKVSLNGNPIVLYLLAMFDADTNQVKWTDDTDEAYLVRYDRFFKTITCIVVDAPTCTAKVIMEETYSTFGFVEYYGSAGQEGYTEPSICYLPKSGELLWHSETEGWSALYLYDLKTGLKKRRYTQDGTTFRRLKYVDQAKREIYFTAGGGEAGMDPYYQILYKAHMDTGEVTRITSENAEHFVRIQPEGLYFIDTYSTVQTIPQTTVCNMAGQTLCTLEQADISKIQPLFITPEPFEALARDGKTKIYGILIKPYDFDPSKKYPVIDYIYGGAQRINVPKAFEFNTNIGFNPFGSLEYYAHLGFVGIIVDGLATPLRSKEIHDYIYEKAEECCGIADHVCAIQQLAAQNPWMDIDRVGMWGASGGGYATARALLEFPEFYKVGVSLCGNHDQARYHAHWGERWIGQYSPEKYEKQANHTLAANLEGKLLLIHGDMDDNVHPGATIKLIDALIEANKDFDSLIYPNSAHAVARFSYVMRKKWDYFVTHLLGAVPPKNFDIKPKKAE